MPRRYPILALLLSIVLFATPALARGEGEITITATNHENRFPAQIKFSVEAQSGSEITRVVLRYKMANDQATSYSNAEFTPGPKVKAEYVWNTQRQYIPPGVDLQYYWQIEDAAGHRAQSASATLTVEDTRFQWQRVDAGRLTLYWYKGDRPFAQDLLDAGTRAVKQLSEEVGAELGRPVKIFIYDSQKDLLGALPPRGVEWTGGEAFPQAGIIVLTASATPRGRDYGLRTVPHELSHLIIHSATDNPFGGVPQWLDEGLAMYAEGDLEQPFTEALKRAASSGNLLSLSALSGNFPTDAEQSLLGYAESYSVVKYLVGTYGRDKMAALLGIFREGSSPDDALRRAYGRDLATLEAAWRASIGAGSGAATPAAPPQGGPRGETPSAATPIPRATAVPSATAARAPTATGVPAQTPASGRSCFGGLLGIMGAMGGLLFVGGRLRT